MVVKREQYVDSLVGSMHNGLIKVVTGIRRCGKSFLLNELFRKRLQEMEIKEDNMLFLKMEDWRNRFVLECRLLSPGIDNKLWQLTILELNGDCLSKRPNTFCRSI